MIVNDMYNQDIKFNIFKKIRGSFSKGIGKNTLTSVILCMSMHSLFPV